MPRIAPLEPPYSDAIQAAFDKAVPGNFPVPALYRTVARNAKVFDTMVNGHVLTIHGMMANIGLDMTARETVILRTTARLNAGYEWSLHVGVFAKASGMLPDQIAATAVEEIDESLWEAEAVLLLRTVDCLLTGAQDDAVLDAAKDTFGEEKLIAIVTTVGYYASAAMIIHVSGVETDPGMPPFPGWTAKAS